MENREIYVMHDGEGDILCAFTSEEKAKIEAEECGVRYRKINLYGG